MLPQLESRQTSDPPNNDRPNNGTDTNDNPSQNSSNGQNNNVIIIVAAIVVFVVAFLVIVYFVLRALRRMNCRPKYIPGKFLKDRWTRWNVGVSYGQVPDGTSSNQTGETAGNRTTQGGPQTQPNAAIRRDTSIRSIISLPAYSYTPKPTEQVIAREGEREGMDMVVEFPETVDEEEGRREEMMESLYQIRLQRRQEIAEREARRQERREARARGDFIRLEQLRVDNRTRANSRESVNGSATNVSAAVALAEAQSRGRDRRISSVSYADVGYVRHDGSRLRASSRDSDSRPLLNDAAGMSAEGPDRSSGLISVHSRGESYSSALSQAGGGSDGESLAPVQSHTTSMHSINPSNTEPEASDVGARNIPPPDYDHLDWGDAPPYEPPTSESNNDNPPRLRELTTLPTIQIDVVSPISNGPATPTIMQREEQQGRESVTDSSRNNTHSLDDTQTRESPADLEAGPFLPSASLSRVSFLQYVASLTMSREHTANSFASFGSDFDPEHEAIASTRELDGSPRLPKMKGAPRKLQTLDEEDEPDYVFNTSTFEQYLPHFSPIGTSEEEEENEIEDDISIEAGRGLANPPRRLDDSRNSYMSIENSVRSSSPAVRLDVPTPQKSALRNTARRAVSENLRKDAQLRQASLAHKENIDPNPPSKPNRKERRTLSEIHAKVRDSYDGSFVEDERPPVVTNSTTRPTRFGNANLSNQIADAVERASQEAYVKEIRRAKSRAATNPGGDTGTQQSFLLPDLPNLSDLVSGVYEDGTPVYTRQPRMRTTRFVSPPADAEDVSLSREHMPLDAIPIPEDEKALFVSLRLLQDKVAELERAKADSEKKLEDLRQENTFLKGGKSRRERESHSKRYEEQNDYKKDRLINENQKLETTNLALQNKVDLLERKSDIQEAALKKLNRERDMAVSQLGVAYLESQDLKSENESLRQEILELKSRFAKVLPGSKEREETGQSEQITASDASTEDSQVDTRQSTTKEVTSKSARSKLKSGRKEDSKSRVSNQVDREISRLEKERAEEALFSIELPRLRESSAKREKSGTRSRTSSGQTKKPSSGKRVKRVVVEEVEVTEPVDSTAEATGHTRKSSTTEQDLTLLSFIDEREIAQLRKTLEEERLARKRRQSTPEYTAGETDNLTRQSALKPAPRKSSMKESKVTIPRPASALGDLTAATRVSVTEGESQLSVPVERPRRHSEHSVTPTTQRRRRRIAEEMTSAFILPDITLHHANLAENLTKLPETTQRALDRATQHNGKNCTVCKQSVPGDCDHTSDAVTIPKPIPVSERMPEPSVYNEEPTLRPAQSPAVALATVLKALEDELSHLRMQLVSYQGAYNKLDASISKRQRKTLAEKIEKVMKDIDMKADQIYALYDVLEGQRQRGQDMTEQEMEVTLQSIGIDANTGRAEVTGTTDKSSRKDGTDYDVDEESELPWEGIESTMEMTGDPTTPDNLSQERYYDHDDSDTDNRSVRTAIHDSDTPHLRLLDPLPISDHQWSDNNSESDEDDPVEAPSEKPVTWFSLPKKGQLAILTIARLSEPLTQTSLQAYLFYQLRSFDPSLPESTISTQAGILQGSFSAAQFLTAVFWGRLADTEWMGRKRVLLIGLFGTCISCVGFGLSRSFAVAAVFRTLGGMLNSNVGVMRTMISEIIEEKKYQSRAFLLLPMCFNIGVIIGPIIGGMLADPMKNYPHLFGPGSVFGGEDGVWWMERWPFALPNLISAIFIFTSWAAVFLGLDETHEVARYKSDWGRKSGRRLTRLFQRRRYRHYQPLTDHPDDTSVYLDESITSRSLPPSPIRARIQQQRRHKRSGFRQIWTPNVLFTLLVQFLLAFHTSAFNSMTFIFLPNPRAPEGSQQGFFRFGGGLGLPSSRVGLATAIIGVIGLPLQIFVYPRIQSRLGTLVSFRSFLPFSPLAYALMPFLVLIPNQPYLVWPAFTVVVGIQVISRTFALPAAVILVNNCVTDASILGTVHGVAQSITSAARTLGPFLGGWGLGLGLEYNLVGGVWWALALEALLGWFLLGTIYEGRGIDRKGDVEWDEGEEGRDRR
ncbi:hypothetical protein BDW59DRAFT_171409 [Aspergillus cavernicola]|uniref:Major facilitator superfamily (MFS) profile domain-containing protein n=1 Tax=Aspergillus cavernicola TaxID=176166 RepID=A0ABR4II47_9EURO